MHNRFVFITWTLLWTNYLAAVGTGPLPTERAYFALPDESKIEYYENHPLTQYNPQINRVIFIVHGIARNADEYFENLKQAVRMEAKEHSTLVIAPHFKIDEDAHEANELVWNAEWKFGDLSATARISSYEVIDRFIEELILGGNFPALNNIVVAGHSAGGQFVTRYAAGSPITDRLGIRISYIVGNPSSYLYFNPQRLNSQQAFSVPKSPCTDYNEYPYGIDRLNWYMSRPGHTELKNRYTYRHVTLFLGESDTLTEDLDMSCGANLQGVNRFQRGLTYFKFLKAFHSESKTKLVTVPGMGHSGKDMYQSAQGRKLLFQW